MQSPPSKPTSLARRFGAMIYDSLLVLALWLTTLFLLVIVMQGEVPRSVVQPIAVVELFAFFAYFWLHRGQTLGMLAWRLRLESADPDHPAIGPRQVLLRFIGACLAFATGGLGYLWQLIDRQNRALPDIVSRTRIVFEPNR